MKWPYPLLKTYCSILNSLRCAVDAFALIIQLFDIMAKSTAKSRRK